MVPNLPASAASPHIFAQPPNYQRAHNDRRQPNVGVCLCVGCWLEGGDLWGATAIEAIRHFASQDKLFKVHFRNVDAPHFVETFIDDSCRTCTES
ncbi:MAG: hypothetical protein U0232_23185 [Thermomicrobiales bacterium]